MSVRGRPRWSPRTLHVSANSLALGIGLLLGVIVNLDDWRVRPEGLSVRHHFTVSNTSQPS